MRLFKRITAAAMAGTLLFTSAYAIPDPDKAVNRFHSFGDFSGTNTIPEGFIFIDNGRINSVSSKLLDNEERTSNIARINGSGEPVIPFRMNFLDGKMHVSFDYMLTNEAEGKTGRMLQLYFSSNATTGNNTEVYGDAYTGALVTDAPKWYIDELDYSRLLKGRTLGIMCSGSEEWGYARTFYSAGGNHTGINADGTINSDMATKEDTWYKVDLYFDRSDNTYEAYVNGIPQNSGFAADGTKLDVKQLMLGNGPGGSKTPKGLIFRNDHMRNYSSSTVNSGNTGGYVYLDNVYVKTYADDDIISLVCDDLNQGGVALTNGKLNIAYSEYMANPAEASDVKIKNMITGDEITDFTVSKSDGMQFLIEFGQTALSPGQYSVEVNNVKGAVSGKNVGAAVYFDTVKNDKAWVENVEFLDASGVAEVRGKTVSTGTESVRVTFNEAVNITPETAGDYITLECAGVKEEISRFEVSEDCKSVRLYPVNLFLGGQKAKVTVSGDLTAKNNNVEFVKTKNGNLIEESVDVADDAICEYSETFVYNSEAKTADFTVNMVKSDSSVVKMTMAVATYKDTADEEGNTVPKMLNISYVPINIGTGDRFIRKYITETVDCTDADRVKAFIWEYPSFKKICLYEEEIQGGAQ